MSAYYKCKICGGEHPGPIPFDDKKSFDSSTLMTRSFQFPVKGELTIDDKEDMFWED